MSGAAKTVIWSPAARIHIRAIDRETAIQILQAVDEYLSTGTGDVKKLRPPRDELRLRVGDYRYSFTNWASAPLRSPNRHRSYGYN
jgi:mRNA-degrading endonuclease RelE of RelBE toxin-antitoxin system